MKEQSNTKVSIQIRRKDPNDRRRTIETCKLRGNLLSLGGPVMVSEFGLDGTEIDYPARFTLEIEIVGDAKFS